LGSGPRFGPFRQADRNIALGALEDVGLADLRHRPLAALSGGERQRSLIARALACEPDILLLDEPTANLDARIQDELYQLLNRLNERLTVVIVSHDVGFVTKFVKSVVCVNRTVMVHHTHDLTGEVIAEMYGHPMRVVHHTDSHCSVEDEAR
jgi:zinc transport system ATP-binding protein